MTTPPKPDAAQRQQRRAEALQRELAEINARNQLANDYQKTLALLRNLQAGAVGLDDFEMTPDGWRLLEFPAPAAVDPLAWEIERVTCPDPEKPDALDATTAPNEAPNG